MNIKSIIRSIPGLPFAYHMSMGILSYFKPDIHVKRAGATATGDSLSARYCYSVFMRHLVLLYENGLESIPKSVAELGPGNSFGVGLCCLIAGSEKYYALDMVNSVHIDENLRLFDELVSLFRSKAVIPDEHEFPLIEPLISHYEFPSHIFSDQDLSRLLDENRIQEIRNTLAAFPEKSPSSRFEIHYIVPWLNYQEALPAFDLVFSQAVLEHVDDMQQVCTILYECLQPNGYMSHTIDFKSHGTAKAWNGHWAFSEKTWHILRGKRSYLINRMPLSAYTDLFQNGNFDILYTKKADASRASLCSIPRAKLKQPFQNLSNEDFNTPGCYILAQKL